MTNSNLFGLNIADFLKAFIMAVLTPVLVIIQQSFALGVLTFDLKAIGLAALSGGAAYLIKQFLTNSNGTPLAPENK